MEHLDYWFLVRSSQRLKQILCQATEHRNHALCVQLLTYLMTAAVSHVATCFAVSAGSRILKHKFVKAYQQVRV